MKHVPNVQTDWLIRTSASAKGNWNLGGANSETELNKQQ